MLIYLGLICSFISLFIIPEIFGSAAILLGAYAWRREGPNSRVGLFVIIMGILFMFVGLYYTAYYVLYEWLP